MGNQAGYPDSLPDGAEIDDGVWSQLVNRVAAGPRRAALFLDRDGVVVEEVNYLHRPEDARLIPGAVDIVGRCNRLGVPAVVVTNQAGIGYGRYGWDAFIAVQEKIADDLIDAGVFVNAVYACPHHADARPPYDTPDHPCRKPNPGMLIRAAEMLPIDLGRSWIVGDRASDLAAGLNAGLAGGFHVLSGHGSDPGEREKVMQLRDGRFQVLTGDSIADARGLALLADTPVQV